MGSTQSLDAGKGELHTWPKHPLSGTDTEYYYEHHVVLPGYQPKGECDCGYMAQYDQVYSGWVGLISLGRMPI